MVLGGVVRLYPGRNSLGRPGSLSVEVSLVLRIANPRKGAGCYISTADVHVFYDVSEVTSSSQVEG